MPARKYNDLLGDDADLGPSNNKIPIPPPHVVSTCQRPPAPPSSLAPSGSASSQKKQSRRGKGSAARQQPYRTKKSSKGAARPSQGAEAAVKPCLTALGSPVRSATVAPPLRPQDIFFLGFRARVLPPSGYPKVAVTTFVEGTFPPLPFKGAASPLSNLHPVQMPLQVFVMRFRSLESAYQSAKALLLGFPDRALDICQMSGWEAMRASVRTRHERSVPAWDAVKDDLMRYLIRVKFSTDPLSRDTLMSTRGRLLTEATGHPYWARTENRLGNYLMERREVLLFGLPEPVPVSSWTPDVGFLRRLAMRCLVGVGNQMLHHLGPLAPFPLPRAPVATSTVVQSTAAEVGTVSSQVVNSTAVQSTAAEVPPTGPEVLVVSSAAVPAAEITAPVASPAAVSGTAGEDDSLHLSMPTIDVLLSQCSMASPPAPSQLGLGLHGRDLFMESTWRWRSGSPRRSGC